MSMVFKLDLRLITFPLECIVAVLAFFDQLISDVLLTVGRPTPSQCAAFELTSRLDVTRAREVALGKAMEEAKVQIAKLSAERDQLNNQVKQARAAITHLEEQRKNEYWSWYCFHGSMSIVGVATSVLGRTAAFRATSSSHMWHVGPAIAALVSVIILMKKRQNHIHLWLFCIISAFSYSAIFTAVLGVLVATEYGIGQRHSTLPGGNCPL